MAPLKVTANTPTQRILSDNLWKRKRPETDYERWQLVQDQTYQPKGQPQYEPSNEYQIDVSALDGIDKLRHGEHNIEDRPTVHGYFASSKPPATPTMSEDAIVFTVRKALNIGNGISGGNLFLFVILLIIFCGAKMSIKRGRRCHNFPLVV